MQSKETVDNILTLAQECLYHAEACFDAGAYNSAMQWVERAKAYQSKLAIVQTH